MKFFQILFLPEKVKNVKEVNLPMAQVSHFSLFQAEKKIEKKRVVDMRCIFIARPLAKYFRKHPAIFACTAPLCLTRKVRAQSQRGWASVEITHQ